MSEIEIKNRSHSKSKSGAKANKNVSKEKSQNNSKGFAINKINKTKKIVQRTLDHQVSKHHLPTNQAVVDCDPPLIAAIFGPPKSGKSTLLRGLVAQFSRQNISKLQGPITVVAGKNIRLTLIECSCDINQMIDIAKVCDILLLIVNTRIGLENYHFEFINLIQAHGMPRVVPILNHIDTFQENQSTRDKLKKLKARLWTDLNAKIFPLKKFMPRKGITVKPNNTESFDGNYSSHEIKRLARLISVKVPRVTDWRLDHPYLLVDRIENNSEVVENDSSVFLYGWVRGSVIPPALTCPGVHIVGVGDFCLKDVVIQPDPCPNPRQLALSSNISMKEIKRKMLTERDRKIYAPMSNVGGVLIDKDSTYIDIGGSHHLRRTKIRPNSILNTQSADSRELDQVHGTFDGANGDLGERLKSSSIKLFSEETKNTFQPMEISNCQESSSDEECEDDDIATLSGEDEESQISESEIQKLSDDNNDEEIQMSDKNETEIMAGFLRPVSEAKHKEYERIFKAFDKIEFSQETNVKINWNKYIYSDGEINLETNDADRIYEKSTIRSTDWNDDLTLPINEKLFKNDINNNTGFIWSNKDNYQMIIDRFTTGKWSEEEDADALIKADNQAIKMRQEAIKELLENERKNSTKYKPIEASNEADKYDCNEEYSDESDNSNPEEVEGGDEEVKDENDQFEKKLLRMTKSEKRVLKRTKQRELVQSLLNSASTAKDGSLMSAHYDKIHEKHMAQQRLNKEIYDSLSPEDREALEGYPPGSYVKIRIDGIPSQFIDTFNPRRAMIIGGLSKNEEAMGFIKTRLLTHRWSHRVLKSFDPLMISIGWRRYQTVVVYAKEEDNLRLRFLKYSLKHHHCHAVMYGPICSPKTGFITFTNSAWRSRDQDNVNFRVTSTGVVLSTNESFDVMKKLKLVGEPSKIFSKTAFITGMFNSALEVNKMMGAKLQTASKIRGIIKSALTGKKEHTPGDFRATFEATIKKADLVFLRAFVKVDLVKFFNPVLDYIGKAFTGQEDCENGWRMMRTCTEMKLDSNLTTQNNPDSYYKPVKRAPFIPLPLEIPVKLASELPYSIKPKMTKSETRRFIKKSLLSKGKSVDDLPFDLDLLEGKDIPQDVIPKTVLLNEIDAGNTENAELKMKDGEYEVVPKENRGIFMKRIREIYDDDRVRIQDSKRARMEKFIKSREEESRNAERKSKLLRKEMFKKTKGKSGKPRNY